MEKDDRLAKKLRDARIRAGLTQSQVADQLGYVSAQFISNWERGLSAPPIKTIRTLAQIYNLPIEDLFETLIEISKSEIERSMRREFKNLKKG